MYATLLSTAVKVFIIHCQQLCRLLRLEGDNLSDVDLHMLMAQLRRVELEATHCQTLNSPLIASLNHSSDTSKRPY